MAQPQLDQSYRALLSVPSMARLLVGMTTARVAGAMVSIAMVLFTLERFHSPQLAGLVTFASIFPGLVASPIAGALLDRHGRSRLVVLDYAVGATSLALVGVLALANDLPAWLLVVISAVASLTGPLSNSGLRSLFPIIVPEPLWERANAVDSNGYVVATLLGPPIAGGVVEVAGGPVALIAIGVVFAIAALVLIDLPDPQTDTATSGRLLTDAWLGLRYTWGNPTLRALAVSIAILNLSGGVMTIALPIIVLDRLHGSAALTGAIWAVLGVGGMVAALVVGRWDTRGRERTLLVWPMAGMGLALLLVVPSAGLAPVVIAVALIGLCNGPTDIALFTLRQRRTDSAWMGRAFAVSMSLNFVGNPIGSVIGGSLAGWSVEAAIVFGAVACFVAAVAGWLMIERGPRDRYAPRQRLSD